MVYFNQRPDKGLEIGNVKCKNVNWQKSSFCLGFDRLRMRMFTERHLNGTKPLILHDRICDFNAATYSCSINASYGRQRVQTDECEV